MENSEAYYKKMTETPVSKLIVVLGIPTTISMLITSIYNLADTYFVGTLGESAQGATGILFTLQCIIQALAFMLGHGSGTFVAKCLAEKDAKQATKYVSTAFFVGAVAGTILMAFGLIFLSPFMRLLGSTETILPYAKDYGLWVLISCPFMVCSLILNNNLRYEGKALYAMIGLGAGGLLNIFMDYIFIEHMYLGVFGAGMSTAISQIISFFILIFFYLKMAQSTISIKAMSRDITDYWNIIRVGFPSFIRQGLTSISNGVLNNLAKPFGDAAIAAISVINRFSSFIMCVGLGIGQGFQPVASFNYQAQEYTRVKKGLVFTLGFSAVLVGLLSLFGICMPTVIIRIFQKEQTVVDIGKIGLRIASIGVLFLPLSVSVNMLYQSIRKAGIASFLALLRSGLVFIPVLVLFSFLWKLDGILWAQPVSDFLSGMISLPFIFYFLFKTPNTEKKEEPEEL